MENRFKEGDLIYWRHESEYRDWNCPGMIHEVTDTHYRIRTFDDMKVHEILNDVTWGENVRKNIRFATEHEVLNYINKRKMNLITARAHKESEVENLNDKIQECEELIAIFKRHVAPST